MQSKLNPYIHFKSNAREAMEFYKSVFGGKLVMNTFKDFNASQDPSEDNKIMHAQLDADNGIALMGADTPNRMEYRPGATITISLSGDNKEELSAYFQKLAAGGMIDEPLAQSPWGDTFGMLTDKYGIEWMVNIAGQKA